MRSLAELATSQSSLLGAFWPLFGLLLGSSWAPSGLLEGAVNSSHPKSWTLRLPSCILRLVLKVDARTYTKSQSSAQTTNSFLTAIAESWSLFKTYDEANWCSRSMQGPAPSWSEAPEPKTFCDRNCRMVELTGYSQLQSGHRSTLEKCALAYQKCGSQLFLDWSGFAMREWSKSKSTVVGKRLAPSRPVVGLPMDSLPIH
jgi:hypothetical protein